MRASDVGAEDGPYTKVLHTFTNADGVHCRVVQEGDNQRMRRVDRWFSGSAKDKEAKWLPWLQSGEANEILSHAAEKEQKAAELEALKAEHEVLKAEMAALKAPKVKKAKATE